MSSTTVQFWPPHRTQGGLFNLHGRVLVAIAADPQRRIRDIAAATGVTQRSAFGAIDDLCVVGAVSRVKVGRRNNYRINLDLPLPGAEHHDLRDLLAALGVQTEATQSGR